MHCDASTDILVQSFSFAIACVDPVIAGNRVGEDNPQVVSWHWPRDNESILPIVSSIVETTILSAVNVAIRGLLDPRKKIGELLGCQEEPNRDGGPYTRNGT